MRATGQTVASVRSFFERWATEITCSKRFWKRGTPDGEQTPKPALRYDTVTVIREGQHTLHRA